MFRPTILGFLHNATSHRDNSCANVRPKKKKNTENKLLCLHCNDFFFKKNRRGNDVVFAKKEFFFAKPNQIRRLFQGESRVFASCNCIWLQFRRLFCYFFQKSAAQHVAPRSDRLGIKMHRSLTARHTPLIACKFIIFGK